MRRNNISRPICYLHDDIKSISEDTLSDLNKLSKTKLKSNLRKIIVLAKDAKEKGIKMEDRLYDYSNAITELGYTRSKKK